MPNVTNYGAVTLRRDPFLVDLCSGAAAGACAGAIIAPVEYLKVLRQSVLTTNWQNVLRSPTTYVNMAKSIAPFSAIFGSVCALEFSINKRIGDQYGHAAGLTASSATGTFFLTASDHLMFYRQKGISASDAVKHLFRIRATALWTGTTPMMAREAVFVTSVMHLGPWVGSRLQKENEPKSLFWSSVGRVISGVGTTLVSQPFDVLARDLQIKLHADPKSRPSVIQSIQDMRAEYRAMRNLNSDNPGSISFTRHPLFRGALPRMGLAVAGGTIAGGFYDMFVRMLDPERDQQRNNALETPKVQAKLRP
jgi:hypothetical protein